MKHGVKMIELLNEVRKIKRKMSVPIKRGDSRGEIIPVEFTEREKKLVIEMINRRSKRHPIKNDKGHIFPEKKKKQFTNSTQKRAMELIRNNKWVV